MIGDDQPWPTAGQTLAVDPRDTAQSQAHHPPQPEPKGVMDDALCAQLTTRRHAACGHRRDGGDDDGAHPEAGERHTGPERAPAVREATPRGHPTRRGARSDGWGRDLRRDRHAV